MADRVKIRTLRRIDAKDGILGASIAAGVEVELPRHVADKLVAEGKAEKVERAKK